MTARLALLFAAVALVATLHWGFERRVAHIGDRFNALATELGR